MADIKFNIYYSSKEKGPWTLANPIPLDNVPGALQQYVVSGLTMDATYYFSIIGGVIEGGEFVPLISQPISNTPTGAGWINKVSSKIVAAQAFIPRMITTAMLSQEFTVMATDYSYFGQQLSITGISFTQDYLGQQFELDELASTSDNFRQQFNISGIDFTESGFRQQFEIDEISYTVGGLSQEFTISGSSWETVTGLIGYDGYGVGYHTESGHYVIVYGEEV